jgi:glycosyltransferase involved in cell wall biosynthesis
MNIIYPLAIDRPGNPISHIHHTLAKRLAAKATITAFRQDTHTKLPGVHLITVSKNKYLQTVQIIYHCRHYGRGDIIHFVPNALLAVLPTRAKRVITIHEAITLTQKRPFLTRTLLYALYRKADVRIAVSRYVQQTVRTTLELPAQVIYNAIEKPQPVPANIRDELQLPHKPLCVFVGTLTPNKHPERVIAAAKALPHITFVIVGDGPLRSNVQRAAAAHENIIAVPFVAHDRLLSWIAQADVFAFPSEQEGFGLVTIEAMAMGTPVVAYKSGATPELLTKKTGVLVTTQRAFVAAIRRVVHRNPFHKRDLRARASTFSWKQTAEQYWEVYHAAR